jgi:hypothetical protein
LEEPFYKTHDEYLNGISTFINLEKDLGLYQLTLAFSNELMSVVGMKILSKSLQAAYGEKKFLLRCYRLEEKFFELPLDDEPNHFDVHETTFSWVMPKQARQVMVMDVSGGIKGIKKHFKRMREPMVIPHEYLGDTEISKYYTASNQI